MGLLKWLQRGRDEKDAEVIAYVKTHPDAFGGDICKALKLSRAGGFLRFARLENEGKLVGNLEPLNENEVRLPRRRFRAV